MIAEFDFDLESETSDPIADWDVALVLMISPSLSMSLARARAEALFDLVRVLVLDNCKVEYSSISWGSKYDAFKYDAFTLDLDMMEEGKEGGLFRLTYIK